MIFSAATDDAPMKTTRDWQAQAKGIIRAELKRRNLTYKDLEPVCKGVTGLI